MDLPFFVSLSYVRMMYVTFDFVANSMHGSPKVGVGVGVYLGRIKDSLFAAVNSKFHFPDDG